MKIEQINSQFTQTSFCSAIATKNIIKRKTATARKYNYHRNTNRNTSSFIRSICLWCAITFMMCLSITTQAFVPPASSRQFSRIQNYKYDVNGRIKSNNYDSSSNPFSLPHFLKIATHIMMTTGHDKTTHVQQEETSNASSPSRMIQVDSKFELPVEPFAFPNGEMTNKKPSFTASLEMTSMSVLGIALTTFIILSLTTDDWGIPFFIAENAEEFDLDLLEEETLIEVELVTQKVIQTTVPSSATDVLALVLGEGMAGTIGAFVNVSVAILFKLREDGLLGFSLRDLKLDPEVRAKLSPNTNSLDTEIISKQSTTTKTAKKESSQEKEEEENLVDKFTTEAIADGDYFFTRAAALTFLEGAGIPASIATVVSVLFASIPYEFIKLNSQRKQQLKKQQEAEDAAKALAPTNQANGAVVKVEKTKPMEIDFVDIFSDVTKWLEYSVLTDDFRGKLFPGNFILESAGYGFLAAFSSQVYADILYRFSDYGPKKVKLAARNRSVNEWISLYVTKCFSSATLFAVYEFATEPIQKFFQSVLTGGVDSCMGSNEFNMCIETFMADNPPTDIASTEAQLRALVIALVGLGDRIGLGFLDGFNDDFFVIDNLQGNVRSIAVSLYSVINHFLPLYT